MNDQVVARLVVIVVVGAILTGVLSLLLLWLYHRAVLRGMDKRAVGGDVQSSVDEESTATKGSKYQLTVSLIDGKTFPAVTSGSEQAMSAAQLSMRKIMLAYFLAGLAYALTITAIYLVNYGFTLGRFLWLMMDYAWPIAIALAMIRAIDRRERFTIVTVYFVLLLGMGIFILLRSPKVSALNIVEEWLLTNGPVTLLLLIFLTRRIRAVGPLVLPVMIAGMTGAVTIPTIIANSEPLLSLTVTIGMALGLDASIYLVTSIAAFLVVSILGLLLLRWIGRRYVRKALSDQMILLDAVWILFAVMHISWLGLQGWAWLFGAVVAFTMYRIVLGICLKRIVRPSLAQHKPQKLLFLRVFSLGSRSQSLFDALSKFWLRTGSISMIAGPDLITAWVEPHEFLDFLAGRLSRQFVAGKADLEVRLDTLDVQPDPDGRFRVNEFFCRTNTWQLTMRRLVALSDGVLMDLRSFSPANQGCLFELGRLLDEVSLERVLLLVDDTTDQVFLEETLGTLWTRIPAESPNTKLTEPTVRLFEVVSGSRAEIQTFLKLLYTFQNLQGLGHACLRRSHRYQ